MMNNAGSEYKINVLIMLYHADRNGVILILHGADTVVTMTVRTFFIAAVKILLAILTIKFCDGDSSETGRKKK
jgi:hypothetical protein